MGGKSLELKTLLYQAEGGNPFKVKGSKTFRQNFEKFWRKLVLASNSAGLTFDDYLLPKLSELLIPMSGCEAFKFLDFLCHYPPLLRLQAKTSSLPRACAV